MSTSWPLDGLPRGAVGSTAGIHYLPLPGQLNLPLPKKLLTEAPWIMVVLTAIGFGWTAIEVIGLVLALTPVAVLTRLVSRG